MPPKKRTARRKPSFRARGERHGNARLTAEQVRAIRQDRAAHDTAFRVLAERYGISVSTVGRVLRREVWAAPEYEPEPSLKAQASRDSAGGVPENAAPGHAVRPDREPL